MEISFFFTFVHPERHNSTFSAVLPTSSETDAGAWYRVQQGFHARHIDTDVHQALLRLVQGHGGGGHRGGGGIGGRVIQHGNRSGVESLLVAGQALPPINITLQSRVSDHRSLSNLTKKCP